MKIAITGKGGTGKTTVAGIEHLGRATAQLIDKMFIVVEPGLRSIQTAHTILKMGKDIESPLSEYWEIRFDPTQPNPGDNEADAERDKDTLCLWKCPAHDYGAFVFIALAEIMGRYLFFVSFFRIGH